MAQPTFLVSWNANQESDIAGYRVYLGKASGQYPDIRDVGKQTSTVLSELTPSTRYYLALQAYNTSGLASQLSQEQSFVTPAPEPEIEVKSIDGDLLVDGSGLVSFGPTSIGSSDAKRKWIVLNRGTGDLTNLSVAVSGENSADFTVEVPFSGTLKPSESAILSVSFNPVAVGPRSARLAITSNDQDESPFEIELAGIGGSPSDLYGTWISSGGLGGANTSPNAAPFHDGISNLLKYAFNLNPGASDVRTLVKATGTAGKPVFEYERVGNQSWFRVEFIRRIGSGLIYTPKISTDLKTYITMTGTAETSRINDQWERVILRQNISSAPPRAMFGRVDVSLPIIQISPEIEIVDSAGLMLSNESTLPDFGTASVDSGDLVRVVTIFNYGNDYLSNIGIDVAGTHANDFKITGPVPGSLAPGKEFSVEISFKPAGTGNRAAFLLFASDDPDEPAISIHLNGIGATSADLFQSWTTAHGLNGNLAAAGAVPHGDGVPNLLKYAFNLNGAGPDRRMDTGGGVGFPVFKIEGNSASRTFVVEYLQRKGTGLIYQPKVSSDLTNFTPMIGSKSVTVVDGEWDRVTVRMPLPVGGRLFGRVDVTLP